jgi:hypothetical protein
VDAKTGGAAVAGQFARGRLAVGCDDLQIRCRDCGVSVELDARQSGEMTEAAGERRVIKRESGGNPRVVSAGNYGLMQIKLPTARSMGYTGNAAGLLDANTNMTYAVKYLAGAYRLANGNHSRAVHYYAAGYYYAAKAKGVSVNSLAQGNDAFAPAATSRNIKFSSRQSLREASRQTDGFGSSPSASPCS